MAYCLRSFIKTLEQVLHPNKHHKKWVLNNDHIPQIQSLFDKATFFQDFLDKSSPLIQETISSLEDQIMDAAQKAADTLESYITDQILSNPKDQSFTIFPPDMGEALHAFEVAKEEVIKIECASQPSYHNNVSPSVSRTRYPDSKNMVVGVEEDLKQLRSRLTSARVTELDVIPIVGMGGMGKTTLARILYDEFSSKSHFDRCAWVTVSQSYDPQLILKTLLACVTRKSLNEINHQETSKLITTLYQTLFGRRYLIVVNDIWSCEAWDALHMAFPQDNKGSRIILTSRENTLANYVKSTRHEMHLINELDVIPIVGMGGIGKTTLARILYDEFSSTSHFDCCAWVTASQNYNPQLILKTILACVTGKTLNEIYHQETNELSVTLYQTLFRRRYLIVVDDIWSCEAWDALHLAFPQDNAGSRIILTSRENTLANYVKSTRHEMHLINEQYSWELLKKIVFSEESCPGEFKEVGERIARNCGGLPLALQVIGGLLSHSERSKDFWEHVTYNISSLIEKTDHQFSGIFSWSFAQLPHYLKPCFLYMGAFPEDQVISASKIIKMWVAEGFLYPVQGKSLEEAAESHMNALVDRNLISVNERKINGKLKSLGMHDLLRDLCLRKAQEKKFLCSKDSIAEILQEDILCHRRFIVQNDDDDDDKEYFLSFKLTSFARSFILIGYATKKILSCLSFKLSLLRVLDVYNVNIPELPETIFQLVNLRYLAIRVRKDFHKSISQLQNLETLIADVMSILVIVYLPQLRHLKILDIDSTDLTIEFPYEKISDHPHENLQSIKSMRVDILLRLRGKLPNLKKLCFYYIEDEDAPEDMDLTCFQNLKTLKICNGILISNFIFPDNLKKLTLFFCLGVSQSLLNVIGRLPNLQILKFVGCEFESTTWEPTEGEFCELQYLYFCETNLENWLATECHFPVLRHLVFDCCVYMNEIPNEIGGIETLEIIEVYQCRPCVFDSAKRILNEQRKFGNYVLQLRLGETMEEEYDDDDDDDDDHDG